MTSRLLDPELTALIKRGLDQSVQQVSQPVQHRLLQARQQALAANLQLSAPRRLVSFSYGFALALSITLVIVLWLTPVPYDSVFNSFLIDNPIAPSTTSSVGDIKAMDVIMSTEDLDFLENMDIYEWLEAEYG